MGQPTREQLQAEIRRLKNELAARDAASSEKTPSDLLLHLLDHVPDLIWAKDLDKRYLFANQAMCDQLLCAPNKVEVLGETDQFFAERERRAHPEDPQWHTFGEICADSDDVVIERQQAQRFDEFGNVHGEFMRLDVHKAPLYDQQGTMIGTVGCGRVVTREKLLEEALERSEARYRSIFNHAPFGIILADERGAILQVNQAFADLFGSSIESLLTQTYHDLVDPHDADLLIEQTAALQTGQVNLVQFDLRARSSRGETLWLRIRGSLVSVADDEPPQQLGLVEDITLQKQAENRLKAERNRFYQVLDHLPALIYLQAPDHSIAFANHIFTDKYGDYRGRPCHQILQGRALPCDSCSTFEVFKDPRPRQWDLYEKSQDAYYEIHEIPFADSDGSPLVMVLGIDVTQRKKARIALQQSEEEQRMLLAQLEAIPDGLILFDLQGKILWSNRHVKPLLRLEAPLAEGQTCQGNICRQARCPDCPVLLCLKDGVFREREFLQGDGRQIHMRCFPLFDPRGKLKRVILHLSDTSRNLNQRVQNLRASQLASIGELAAGIAHEINNPLNGIINFAQILQDKPEILQQYPDIPARLLKEGERIARIVSGLLGFTRTSTAELQRIDIQQLVKDVLLLVETQMHVEGIRIEVDIAADSPMILVHPAKLEQILFNLLSNARHALNARFPLADDRKRILIEGCRTDEGLQLRIIDAGVGITKEDLPHLCSPFFTTKPEGEGSGLGLSICWQLVQEHGGQLVFDSSPGEGTTVTLRLPLQPPH